MNDFSKVSVLQQTCLLVSFQFAHAFFLVEGIKTISKISKLCWAECSSMAGQDPAARTASLE